jgi:hypothetical protein
MPRFEQEPVETRLTPDQYMEQYSRAEETFDLLETACWNQKEITIRVDSWEWAKQIYKGFRIKTKEVGEDGYYEFALLKPESEAKKETLVLGRAYPYLDTAEPEAWKAMGPDTFQLVDAYRLVAGGPMIRRASTVENGIWAPEEPQIPLTEQQRAIWNAMEAEFNAVHHYDDVNSMLDRINELVA